MFSKRRWALVAISAAAMIMLSRPALAKYSCVGPVVGVTVDPEGRVSAEHMAGFRWKYLCNVDTTANNVGPATCKAMLSLLMSVEAQQKSVRLWFNDGGTCDSHPAWSYLSGWYFGPEIMP
jgi:hypothetical protein